MKIRLLVTALIVAIGTNTFAAILISNTETLLTLDSYPSPNDWRTVSVGFDSGGPVITTPAQLDAQVQTRSVASVSNVLGMHSGLPPASHNFAVYNSAGQYIHMRNGNNWCAVLVAILRNDTGTVLPRIEVAGDFGTGGLLPNQPEELPGLRTYFSLSGESNSWVHIPALTMGNNSTGRLTAVLEMAFSGGWQPGNAAYLLWADDNGIVGDAYHIIDNLLIATAPRLRIARTPTNGVELSWNAGWTNVFVEVTSTLPAVSWERVLQPVMNSNGQASLTLPATNVMHFFRLSPPAM
jgi:hypothetical protein